MKPDDKGEWNYRDGETTWDKHIPNPGEEYKSPKETELKDISIIVPQLKGVYVVIKRPKLDEAVKNLG